MSVESEATTDDDGPGIGPCKNAEEYAIELLESTDGPVTPAQAAEGHGCTSGYMQDVLRESDATERVDIGEYVLSTEETTGGEDMQESAESDDVAPFEAPAPAEDEDRGTERPSADGPVRSEDLDIAAGDRDGESGSDRDDDLDEQDDGEQDDGGADVEVVEDVTKESSVAVPASIDPRTLMLGVAVLVVGYIAYQQFTTGSDEKDGRKQRKSRSPSGGMVPNGGA